MPREVVGRDVILFQSFEELETNFFMKNVSSSDICFDVGANIGYFSLLFASLSPKGEVHSFEPIKQNIKLIQKSVHLNKFKNIYVNNMALSNFDGNSLFSISSDSAFSSFKNTGRKLESKKSLVRVVKIDSYLKKKKIPRIDILKIDVEGAEKLVLEGAKTTLSNKDKKPRIILIELFEQNLNSYNCTAYEILKYLNAFGYKGFTIDRSESKLLRINNKSLMSQYNFVFTL
jgi:FkbM family methyltransferase